MATKLHELLAVQGNLEGQASKTRADLTATFEKKPHLFRETRKTYTSKEEDAKPTTEEQQDIQTTVKDELAWVGHMLAKVMDVGHHIDLANTQAKADVTVEDETSPLLTGVPATSLLQLEKRLKEVHDLVVAIPTLDPAKGFSADTDRAKGIYKAREVRKARTKKVQKALVKYPATPEHPAQTEMITGVVSDDYSCDEGRHLEPVRRTDQGRQEGAGQGQRAGSGCFQFTNRQEGAGLHL